LGVWFDTYFVHAQLGKSFVLKLGTGLDIDISSMTLTVFQKSDAGDENPLATASSKLTVGSLRVSLPLEYRFTPTGLALSFGTHILVPVFKSGPAAQAEVTDAGAIRALRDTAAADDLILSIKHTKPSAAAHLFIAASIGI